MCLLPVLKQNFADAQERDAEPKQKKRKRKEKKLKGKESTQTIKPAIKDELEQSSDEEGMKESKRRRLDKGKFKATVEEVEEEEEETKGSGTIPLTAMRFVDKVVHLNDFLSEYPVPRDGSGVAYLINLNQVPEEEWCKAVDGEGNVIQMITRWRSAVSLHFYIAYFLTVPSLVSNNLPPR
jgi:hypothetical protein